MDNNIKQAIWNLKQGNLVIFPTETVYGLACDATNDLAVNKIYQLKSRQHNNPLSIMVSSLDIAYQYGEFNDKAIKLAQTYWPGPLTLVVPQKKQSNISQELNKGLDAIGIRIPNHSIALEILKGIGIPLAVTSANISGQQSSINIDQVKKYFRDLVFFIDGGNSKIGVPSTVVDATTSDIKILRQGTIIANPSND